MGGVDEGETPFSDHLGETVLAVSEDGAPDSGRLALEIIFGSGRVRCETWSGDLRLSSSRTCHGGKRVRLPPWLV
ncbi:hypothetical protein GCM10017674_77070 [Streptomyces gardneri]|uniref:Uncharacterized protein n=1 Tax=Streptomyces gardneri TaxID=66892 RepID=A0A4Y3RW82_9ACTN|nr:hypothetical protein SGA01_57950 [Streptomyces gardneri]GHH21859.1 hypothetical protein GCM10017674_77070 [Streptomyces gardneri]